MSGTLYGVGVGPGDPELLTIKAIRIIKEADVIAVPGEEKSTSVAYKIALAAVPAITSKQVIAIHMPMTKDPKCLEESHEKASCTIADYLEKGKTVAFLTLGDPTIYSTYIYIHKRIKEKGFPTEIISGIPSFCAVAARLNEGLVEKEEQLHIIPSSYDIEPALSLPGTKVLMKAGKKIGQVIELLNSNHCHGVMVENCGMDGEKIYEDLSQVEDHVGYYSLIMVKED